MAGICAWLSSSLDLRVDRLVSITKVAVMRVAVTSISPVKPNMPAAKKAIQARVKNTSSSISIIALSIPDDRSHRVCITAIQSHQIMGRWLNSTTESFRFHYIFMLVDCAPISNFFRCDTIQELLLDINCLLGLIPGFR